MTLPPCPIAGHNDQHHYHAGPKNMVMYCDDDSVYCDHKGAHFSRCYSAHVPEPTPDPDELVRVPVGVTIPEGTVYCLYQTSEVNWTPSGSTHVLITRFDLDAILRPSPTPAEKLAEAITNETFDEAWTAAQVQAALDAAGLTLAERGDA